MDLNNILNNIKRELDRKSIEQMLKDNYINFNRCEIYINFIRILTTHVYDTYLGREYIKTNEDIEGHFNWCFNKTCDAFISMGVDFSQNKDVKDYFFDYFTYGLYKTEKGKEYMEDMVATYFRKIFEFGETKVMMDMMCFIDIYSIFNLTFIRK